MKFGCISCKSISKNIFKHGAIALILILATSLTCSNVALAEFKIATVDINRIINESEQAKSIKRGLDEKTLKTKKEVEQKKNSLKALEDKLVSQKVAKDSAEAENYRTQMKDFSRFVKDADEELKREFLKANRQMTEKILKIVQDHAKKHKIDLVLDKSSNSRGPVLFGSAGSDITDNILKLVK